MGGERVRVLGAVGAVRAVEGGGGWRGWSCWGSNKTLFFIFCLFLGAVAVLGAVR